MRIDENYLNKVEAERDELKKALKKLNTQHIATSNYASEQSVRSGLAEEENKKLRNCVNCFHGKKMAIGQYLINFGCDAPFGTQENFTGVCCDGWEK